jgi:hypothetical protein
MLEPILGSPSAERVLIYIFSRDTGYAREMSRFDELLFYYGFCFVFMILITHILLKHILCIFILYPNPAGGRRICPYGIP